MTTLIDLLKACVPDDMNMITFEWRAQLHANLEKLAESAVVVSGYRDDDEDWIVGTYMHDEMDTHTAFLLAITPLRKADPLAERLRAMANNSGCDGFQQLLREAADRIDGLGGGK